MSIDCVERRKKRSELSKSTQGVGMSTYEDYWLTRPEVGDRLKVPVKTLAQWATRGEGPPYRRFGRHCRYRLSDLIAWENAQLTGGAA